MLIKAQIERLLKQTNRVLSEVMNKELEKRTLRETYIMITHRYTNRSVSRFFERL